MDLKQTELLTRYLMDEHGFSDWSFFYNDAKIIFGICKYRKKRIELSYVLTHLNSFKQVLDTILHEIAHAIAGPQAKHGWQWQKVAGEIGCDGKRCYNSHETEMPQAPYQYFCEKCGSTKMFRFKRSNMVYVHKSCGAPLYLKRVAQ